MNTENSSLFKNGLKDGIPIALGYLSVSFGFGITAVNGGISPLAAVLISLTNLTSAGQVAGVGVILALGSLLEMALTQLTINIRYFLMSISLSQKLDKSFGLTDAGEAEMVVANEFMLLKIPRSVIGMENTNTFYFKVADPVIQTNERDADAVELFAEIKDASKPILGSVNSISV